MLLDLNEQEAELIVLLRAEAERILREVPQTEQAEALSQLYAWRNDKIVTKVRTSS